jgi:tungstate transport system substrate-binding protein
MKQSLFFSVIVVFIIIFLFQILKTNERPVTFMATTTTEDSGLLSVIIPALEQDTGLKIQVVTFGTGKVLRSAQDGNADIILVHDELSEKEFMNNGFGQERIPVLQNDFVLIGPKNDPFNIKNKPTITETFKTINEANLLFVSRGDESGTHKAEERIWLSANLNTASFNTDHYLNTGVGMGNTLNITVEKNAYTLTDRATWVTFKNKGNLDILFSEDILLRNIYSLITVNSNIHTHISSQKQQLILNWFKSEKFKSLISDYKVSNQSLFKTIS